MSGPIVLVLFFVIVGLICWFAFDVARQLTEMGDDDL